MNRKSCLFMVLSLFLVANVPSAALAELDVHLEFLSPLFDKDWTGGYAGPDAPDIEISLRFEPILGGKAVRYLREAEAADFTAQTFFYWDQGRGEVRFLSLNNRGIVEEGVVSEQEGRIILRGKSSRPAETIEFRTILEITPDGVLRDDYKRLEEGEWVKGHIQEFRPR